MSRSGSQLSWVVLTTGSRPPQLAAAVRSLVDGSGPEIVVLSNGGGEIAPSPPGVTLIEVPENLGVPGGRDCALRSTAAPIVGFLDDDAVFRGSSPDVVARFDADDRLAVVGFRIVDERGATARRHVPMVGSTARSTSVTDVAYFLGGACAIRREAYEQVGGYMTELFYGHEEIELSWRLIDRGWRIEYDPAIEVFHPRSEISRHADGWFLTGRNRVWIARRTLPWPIALIHVGSWLVAGAVRAPGGPCRASYLRGWWAGWRGHIDRQPIRWKTVWRLARLGRPPVV